MSANIDRLVKLFAREPQMVRETESFDQYEIEFTSPNPSEPTSDEIKSALEAFPSRDQIIINITVRDDEDPIQIASNHPAEIADALASLKSKLEVGDAGDNFVVGVKCHKTLGDHSLSVYNEAALTTWLKSLKVANQLAAFDERVKLTPDHFVLRIQDDGVELHTKTIALMPERTLAPNSQKVDRSKIIGRRNDSANFADGFRLQLVPEDFRITNTSQSPEWRNIFTILENTLAVAFVADYSALEDGDKLRYKINGYRTVDGTISCGNLTKPEFSAAYKIYEWAYEGGATSDKLGLLRNILTLHLSSVGYPQFDESVFQSICSGFEIYLKKNVAQYIEIKNKLAEFLTELNDEALQETKDYGSALTQSLGALFTYFVTVVIVNSVTGNGIKSIFNRDITILTGVLILSAAVYLVLSLLLLEQDKRRIVEKHNRIKDRYKDLLDPTDLKHIFDDDNELKAITGDMASKRDKITLAWVLTLILLIIVLFLLGRLNDTPPAVTPPPAVAGQPQIPAPSQPTTTNNAPKPVSNNALVPAAAASNNDAGKP